MAIINCWVTTRNYIAPNETLGLNYGITNNSTLAIKKVRIYLYNTIGSTKYYATNYVEDTPTINSGAYYYTTRAIYALSLDENSTGSLGSNIYAYMNSLSIGSTNSRNVALKARIIVTFGNNATADSGDIEINGQAINKRMNPRLSSLLFTRCDSNGVKSDTGTKLLSTIKTTFNYPELYSIFRLVLSLSGTSNSEQTIPAGDTRLEQFKNGIVDSDLLINLFTLTADGKYSITATLTDDIETFTTSCDITNAFANLHLSSASNGGVAIGMFSTSTSANPKFEVNYRTYLKQDAVAEKDVTINGGLQVNDVVNVGSETNRPGMNVYGNLISTDSGSHTYTSTGWVSVGTSLTVGTDLTVKGDTKLDGLTQIYGGLQNIRGGLSGVVSISANSEYTFTILFNLTYKYVPYVVCNLYGTSGLGLTSYYITTITTSQFKVTVKNNGSAAHDVRISWMAFGILNS